MLYRKTQQKRETPRALLISVQDDRNARLKRKNRRQRKKIRNEARSLFRCNRCDRNVEIPWISLDSSNPACQECGCKLNLVVAILTPGVIPRSDFGKGVSNSGR